jgi:hypothetical protein
MGATSHLIRGDEEVLVQNKHAMAQNRWPQYHYGMLARAHYSVMGANLKKQPKVDISSLEEVTAPRVLTAMKAAHQALNDLGIRHWLVGGLAVGAHGFRCATEGVDFYVGDEAFQIHGGGLVSMKPNMPISINGVPVDHLSSQGNESFLTDLLPASGTDLVVAPFEVLAYLKLKSPRMKDRVDIVELIKVGADVEKCAAWLQSVAPQFVADFKALIVQAQKEEG